MLVHAYNLLLLFDPVGFGELGVDLPVDLQAPFCLFLDLPWTGAGFGVGFAAGSLDPPWLDVSFGAGLAAEFYAGFAVDFGATFVVF